MHTQKGVYELALEDLKLVKTVTLPRPYPTFLPYYLEHNMTVPLDLKRVEFLQLSIGPELSQEELSKPNGIAIIKVQLN